LVRAPAQRLVHPFDVFLLWDIHYDASRGGRTPANTRAWFGAIASWKRRIASWHSTSQSSRFPNRGDQRSLRARGSLTLIPGAVRVPNDVARRTKGHGCHHRVEHVGQSTLLRAMGVAAVLALASAPFA
jgi:hypothetical protein